MHLDRAHGRTHRRRSAGEGWTVDATVPWPARDDAGGHARHAPASAMAGLARQRSNDSKPTSSSSSATASRRSRRRRRGTCRAASSPTSTAATGRSGRSTTPSATRSPSSPTSTSPRRPQSAARIRRLGEDRVAHPPRRLAGHRRHRGARGARWARSTRAFPGLTPQRYALLVLHPDDAGRGARRARAAELVLRRDARGGLRARRHRLPEQRPRRRRHPPRAGTRWRRDRRVVSAATCPRPLFLGLMRDAAVLVGNSSSGIIEAASFGTPVVDVGPRQAGRERSGNVVNVPLTRGSDPQGAGGASGTAAGRCGSAGGTSTAATARASDRGRPGAVIGRRPAAPQAHRVLTSDGRAENAPAGKARRRSSCPRYRPIRT